VVVAHQRKVWEAVMTETNTRKNGRILAVWTSPQKGTKKTNLQQGRLIEDFGLEQDAHAGKWHRQISLLAAESIDEIRQKGVEVGPWRFCREHHHPRPGQLGTMVRK